MKTQTRCKLFPIERGRFFRKEAASRPFEALNLEQDPGYNTDNKVIHINKIKGFLS